jgi:hypothetical protein
MPIASLLNLADHSRPRGHEVRLLKGVVKCLFLANRFTSISR